MYIGLLQWLLRMMARGGVECVNVGEGDAHCGDALDEVNVKLTLLLESNVRQFAVISKFLEKAIRPDDKMQGDATTFLLDAPTILAGLGISSLLYPSSPGTIRSSSILGVIGAHVYLADLSVGGKIDLHTIPPSHALVLRIALLAVRRSLPAIADTVQAHGMDMSGAFQNAVSDAMVESAESAQVFANGSW